MRACTQTHTHTHRHLHTCSFWLYKAKFKQLKKRFCLILFHLILSVQLIAWSSESSGVFIIFPVDQEKMEAEVFLQVVNTNGVIKWFYVLFSWILSLFTASSCHQCSQCTHCLLFYTYLTLLTQSLSVLTLVSVSVQTLPVNVNYKFTICHRCENIISAHCYLFKSYRQKIK